MRCSTIALTGALCLTVVACGGDSGSARTTGPNTLAKGSMSASIDGRAWAAAVSVAAVRNANNIIAVSGGDATPVVIAFALVDSGPRTYTISNRSATNAFVTMGGNAWSASLSQGSGSVTITSLTATEVKGTFAFTGVAPPGANPGTRVVSNGQFDVKF